MDFLRRQLSRVAALLKGYGRDACINKLLAFVWALLTELQLNPHFEWLQYDFNVSDKVSCGDESEAVSAGWCKLEFHVEPLFSILLRVADDLQYATSQAVRDCLAQTIAW